MLAFIIPLKSSRVSGSWELVCKLFERTLKSVCNQTSSNYCVIVVCHEKPILNFDCSHVTYIQVDLPLPDSEYSSKEKDKMLKMQVGLHHAKAMSASHIMFVDADDCISNRLAEFAEKNSAENGWFFCKGFDYQESIQRLRVRNKNLHLRTNSSHIVRLDLLEPELMLNPDDVKRGDCVLYHIDTAFILKERGAPLKPLPFKGVIYITDNGENMWWSQDAISRKNVNFLKFISMFVKSLYQACITQPVTDLIRDEFSLYEINIIKTS